MYRVPPAGLGGLPLALRLSEGLGVAIRGSMRGRLVLTFEDKLCSGLGKVFDEGRGICCLQEKIFSGFVAHHLGQVIPLDGSFLLHHILRL